MKTAKKESQGIIGDTINKGIKKRITVDNPKVELISYSMKMTIPTGQYANIIPEIVVKAGTIEQAHDFIAPHFNKLWKEYYLVSERRPEPVAPQQAPAPQPPASSVAFTKASQAIASCLSMEALDIIQHQIEKSVKLNEDDKVGLLKMSTVRAMELKNGK
jgi:hypothetical protein